jgi:hypothetical protein
MELFTNFSCDSDVHLLRLYVACPSQKDKLQWLKVLKMQRINNITGTASRRSQKPLCKDGKIHKITIVQKESNLLL